MNLRSDGWQVASSVDEARSMVGRAFRENQLEPIGGRGRIGLCSTPLGSSSLIAVAAHGGWAVDPAPNADFFVEHVAIRGELGIRYGEESERCSAGRGVVISTTQPAQFRLGRDTVLIGIRVGRDKLEKQLRLLTDRTIRDPIEFEVGVDLTRGNGARRNGLIRAAMAGTSQPKVLGSPSFALALEDAYLTALLTGQPHSHRHLLEAGQSGADRAAVRRVEEYIRAHPEQPIRSETLVALSGVCTSALYDAFKRLRGTTPMRLLRDVRLERVREQLLQHPDTTVTLAALEWGFLHLARFSGVYARRFGELPSETLKQARRRTT